LLRDALASHPTTTSQRALVAVVAKGEIVRIGRSVGADKNCIINIRHVGYQLCVPIEIY